MVSVDVKHHVYVCLLTALALLACRNKLEPPRIIAHSDLLCTQLEQRIVNKNKLEPSHILHNVITHLCLT